MRYLLISVDDRVIMSSPEIDSKVVLSVPDEMHGYKVYALLGVHRDWGIYRKGDYVPRHVIRNTVMWARPEISYSHG